MKRRWLWVGACLALPVCAFAAGAEGEAHGAAHEGGHGGVPVGQVVASVINFGLYVLLLVWLAKSAVKNFYRKRTEELNEAVNKAAAMLEEATRLHDDAAGRLAHAQEEADRILQNAKELAGRQSHDIIASAKSKSEKILTDAQATIAAETARLEKEMREEMSRRVVDLAKGQLDRDADASAHRRLVSDYLDHVGEV